MYADRRIYWKEGMLLQPQHFQIADRRADRAIPFSGPFPWGVRALRIREDALALQTFAVDELDMVLPCGERVILGENAVLVPRQFEAAWTSQSEPLLVWIGLAASAPGLPDVAECDMTAEALAQARARYVTPISPERVPDLHGEGPDADVRFLYANLRLIFGTETALLDSMPAVPLARLIRDGSVIRLDPDYVPPSLELQSAPRLVEWMQGIRNIILARAKQLEDYKLLPPAGASSASDQITITARSLGLYMMLGALSRHIPLLDHLFEAPSVHPWTAYGALRQLVGELSLFSPDLFPAGDDASGRRLVPEYDHTALGDCFETIHLIISRLASTLITGPAHSFLFEEGPDGLRFCHIPPHVRPVPYRYWLQLRNSRELGALRELLLSRGKLAPSTTLPALVSKALPGVRLIPSATPPSGLPRREDTLYFAVDQDDTLWQSGIRSGELGLFLPGAPEGTTAHLTLMQA